MPSNTENSVKGRPILLGEVLFDRFPGGQIVLGGAPFNVAWHLKGFGADPLFISRVGKDALGEKARGAMRDWDMDLAGLQEDAHHGTGVVDITLDGGQPTFDIMADKAYDHVDVAAAESMAMGEGGLFYHGSLILRTAAMRGVLDTLLAGSALPVFVDVNLRAPWWDASHIPPILQRARWVKVNDGELAIIAGILGCGTDDLMGMARYVRATCDIRLLIVTRGAQGAVALDESDEAFSVAPEVSSGGGNEEIVDTVGAGDAFSAVIILGLLRGWPLPVMMEKAQSFAGRVCRLRGALTTDSDFYR